MNKVKICITVLFVFVSVCGFSLSAANKNEAMEVNLFGSTLEIHDSSVSGNKLIVNSATLHLNTLSTVSKFPPSIFISGLELSKSDY